MNRKYLKMANEYLSNFEFDELDIDRIFENVRTIIDEDFNDMLSDIIDKSNIDECDDLNDICQKIVHTHDKIVTEIHLMTSRIEKTDGIIDFVQNFLLERI